MGMIEVRMIFDNPKKMTVGVTKSGIRKYSEHSHILHGTNIYLQVYHYIESTEIVFALQLDTNRIFCLLKFLNPFFVILKTDTPEKTNVDHF